MADYNESESIDLNKKVLELDAMVDNLNIEVNNIKTNVANNLNNNVANNNVANNNVANNSKNNSGFGELSLGGATVGGIKGVWGDQKNDDKIDLVHVQKGMLFFYLILLGNFIAELLGCKVQYLFDNNQLAKHIVGFITLYFFVFVSDEKISKKSPFKTLGFSVLIYIWFLISAKMDHWLWFGTIILLFIVTVVQVFKSYVANKLNEAHAESNKDFEPLDHITSGEKVILDYGSGVQKMCTVTIILVTIIGFLSYVGMKKVEYKNNWSWYTFFLGVKECTATPGSPKELELPSINKYTYFIKKAFN